MTHYFNIQWTLKLDSNPVVEHRTFSFEVTNPELFAVWDNIKAAIEVEVNVYCNDNSVPVQGREIFVEQVYYSFVE